MSKWIFVSVPCLTCLSFLAAGARPRQVSESARVAGDAFTVCSLAFEHAGDGSPDGRDVFEQARAKLRNVRWLSVTIWQRLHDADHPYESTARLLMGPDHCARMETTVHAGAASCQHLLVSDGRAVAEVERFAGAAEQVNGFLLPGTETGPQREQFLRRRGCTGPLPLLEELQTIVHDWQMQAGTWRERPVVRLQGTITSGRVKGDARHATVAGSCRLYVDAASQLPLRLEWFKRADPSRSPLHLEMEYRDLELNHALTPHECARAFTYVPRLEK